MKANNNKVHLMHFIGTVRLGLPCTKCLSEEHMGEGTANMGEPPTLVSLSAPLLVAEISAFQDISRRDWGADSHNKVCFQSVFSFPGCCFDGLDWRLHGTSPPASHTSLSN